MGSRGCPGLWALPSAVSLIRVSRILLAAGAWISWLGQLWAQTGGRESWGALSCCGCRGEVPRGRHSSGEPCPAGERCPGTDTAQGSPVPAVAAGQRCPGTGSAGHHSAAQSPLETNPGSKAVTLGQLGQPSWQPREEGRSLCPSWEGSEPRQEGQWPRAPSTGRAALLCLTERSECS